MAKKISIFERTDKPFDPNATQRVSLPKSNTREVPAYKAPKQTGHETKEVPAFKAPEPEARKPLKASAEASKFLKKFGPKTKLETPFDKAHKEVSAIEKGLHKDTTSVAGRMKAAGLPAPKEGFKPAPSGKGVDLLSPLAKEKYQAARAGGKVSVDTNLERPAIYRGQEKAAAGLGAHEYNVAKQRQEPVTPKAAPAPEPAKTEPAAPSAGSASMADNHIPKAQEAPKAAAPKTEPGFTKEGEHHPLKRERQTTPRGKKVVGEPEAPKAEPKAEEPPPPPAGPPPLSAATPEYRARKAAERAAEKAAAKPPAPPPQPKAEEPAKPVAAQEPVERKTPKKPPLIARATKAFHTPGLDAAISTVKNIAHKSKGFIDYARRVKKY